MCICARDRDTPPPWVMGVWSIMGCPSPPPVVWCGMVWYDIVLYGLVWYGMVWYGKMQFAKCGSVWHVYDGSQIIVFYMCY